MPYRSTSFIACVSRSACARGGHKKTPPVDERTTWDTIVFAVWRAAVSSAHEIVFAWKPPSHLVGCEFLFEIVRCMALGNLFLPESSAQFAICVHTGSTWQSSGFLLKYPAGMM
jgi:hypothetical protein